ncbi:PBSX family phage terminase large subunit [Thermosipho sp. 1074]|uniref:PBSX family phage terminase large subunit n=1 Tax=Thermosipho sp. 1074 TaxID=1643331 RepID=UPI0009863C72|nr:PBSX family phage terminase large subunit [Thermosipho sp. 1074]OOC42182.1 terminase [Thermosipho sp. 1074]
MKKNKAFEFKPFSKKQKKLLFWWAESSPHKDKDIVIADGSIRSGKTIAMIVSFLMWSQYTFSGKDFILAGKTIGALKRNVVKPMLQILNTWKWDYKYNRSENYIIIGSNTYYMFGANNEASQDVLQGLTAAGALADEVTLFPENFVEQMIGRCSIEGSKIFMNCNPGSPFHYVKTEFIDKALEKQVYHLHFTLDDNLTLSEKIKKRYKKMFTGLFYKRYILGLWVLAEGVIYDMFDADKHVIKEVPKCDEYIVSIDYGTGNPTVFLLIGIKEAKYYVIDEYYYSGRDTGRQKTDSEYADDFVNFVKEKNITAVYADPSAASFIAELRKRGYYVIPADNVVLDGIRYVANLISQDRLFVHEKCRNTITEFTVYSWDPKAAQRGEDKPLKEHDHTMDALRYGIFTHSNNGKVFSAKLDIL